MATPTDISAMAANLKQVMEDLVAGYFWIPSERHDYQFQGNGKHCSHNSNIVRSILVNKGNSDAFYEKDRQFQEEYQALKPNPYLNDYYYERFLDKRFYDYYMAELHPKGA